MTKESGRIFNTRGCIVVEGQLTYMSPLYQHDSGKHETIYMGLVTIDSGRGTLAFDEKYFLEFEDNRSIKIEILFVAVKDGGKCHVRFRGFGPRRLRASYERPDGYQGPSKYSNIVSIDSST